MLLVLVGIDVEQFEMLLIESHRANDHCWHLFLNCMVQHFNNWGLSWTYSCLFSPSRINKARLKAAMHFYLASINYSSIRSSRNLLTWRRASFRRSPFISWITLDPIFPSAYRAIEFTFNLFCTQQETTIFCRRLRCIRKYQWPSPSPLLFRIALMQ